MSHDRGKEPPKRMTGEKKESGRQIPHTAYVVLTLLPLLTYLLVINLTHARGKEPPERRYIATVERPAQLTGEKKESGRQIPHTAYVVLTLLPLLTYLLISGTITALILFFTFPTMPGTP
jgi:hypothetical protein